MYFSMLVFHYGEFKGAPVQSAYLSAQPVTLVGSPGSCISHVGKFESSKQPEEYSSEPAAGC